MSESYATLRFDYQWPVVNSKNLFNAIRTHVIPFVGENANLWCRLTQRADGIDIEHRSNSLDELEQTLSDLESRKELANCQLDFSLSAYPGERRFAFRLKFSETLLSGDVKVEANNIKSASQLLEAIRLELGASKSADLEPVNEYRPLASVERHYYLPPESTPKKIFEIVDHLDEQLPPSARQKGKANGEYRYGTEELSIASLAEWRQGIEKQWMKLDSTFFRRDSDQFEFYIHYFVENEELIVQVEMPNQQDCLQLFEKLETNFGLLPYIQQRNARNGYRRQYYAHRSLEADWVKKVVNVIQSRFQAKRNFYGSYEIRTAPDQENHTEDVAQWENQVVGNWSELTGFSASWSRSNLLIDINCDPQREIIRLRVETTQQEKLDSIFTELEKELAIDLISAKPFQIRTFNDYKISSAWVHENLAAGIEEVLAQFFSDKFVLVKAVIVEESDNHSEPMYYTTLVEYLKRVRETKPFARLELYVEGPRGQALGIYLNDVKKSIGFDSTRDKHEFAKLEDTFKPLGLKKIKHEDKKSADEQPQQSGWDFIIKVVLPIGTFIIGLFGILASAAWSNIIPSYTLKITAPINAKAGNNNDTVTLPSGEVYVDWQLIKRQMFQDTVKDNSSATIRVLENGNKTIKTLPGQTDDVALNLPPGEYLIYVIDEETKQDETVKVSIQTPTPQATGAAQPTQAPPVSPTP